MDDKNLFWICPKCGSQVKFKKDQCWRCDFVIENKDYYELKTIKKREFKEYIRLSIFVVLGMLGCIAIAYSSIFAFEFIKEKRDTARAKVSVGFDNEDNDVIQTTNTISRQQVNVAKEYRDVEFRNINDVYIYLNGYRFVADDGSSFSFDRGGRYMMSGKGNIISTDVRILDYRKKSATIVAYTQYNTRSTFVVRIEDYSHFIYDPNDGTIYKETSKWSW